MVNPDTERDDLTIPLAECGTGVGQVLAMVYAITVENKPKVIVIDEPQSFLHPGAVRELFRLLQRFDHHQYIVATHAPALVSSNAIATLTLVQHDGASAKLVNLPHSETESLGRVLRDLGASLADVFAAEQILWVEGATEEQCFPLLIPPELLEGVVILGVKSTGDFKAKHAHLTFQIYKSLSLRGAVLPPALAFVFDREGLTETQVSDLKRAAPVPMEMIPRRMYENYLLEPPAISEQLRRRLREVEPADSALSEAGVRHWITDNGAKFGWLGEGDKASADGAKLLTALFEELSDGRLYYDKIRDGLELTKWLLENRPEALEELSLFLSDVLRRAGAASS
jgi:hypothetical protein